MTRRVRRGLTSGGLFPLWLAVLVKSDLCILVVWLLVSGDVVAAIHHAGIDDGGDTATLHVVRVHFVKGLGWGGDIIDAGGLCVRIASHNAGDVDSRQIYEGTVEIPSETQDLRRPG